MKAIFNQKIIADSNDTIVIEGNYYFPKQSVHYENLSKTDFHTTCPWKGEASYFTIKVDNKINENGAWYYPNPKPTAKEVVGVDFSNYVAFWQGVEIIG